MLGIITKGIKTILTGKIPIVGDIVGGFADHFKHKRDLKRAIELAKIERVTKLDTADVEWDEIQAKNSESSWKDEYWTVVLSAPIWIGIFPDMQPYIKSWFIMLENDVPDWYITFIAIAIGSAFAYRKIVDPFISKQKGVKNSE